MVKEFDKIIEQVGQIDLTSYVNFSQIKKIAEANAQSNQNIFNQHQHLVQANGPMPQGLFLECMGITMRLEVSSY